MIHSIVGNDGSARIELDGRTVKIREHTVDDARDKVYELAIQYAAETGVMQLFKATDPLGTWPMYIYPNGTTVPAPADVVPPTPHPPQPIPEAYREAVQQPLIEEVPRHLTKPEPELPDGIEHTVLVARATARPTLVIHLNTGESVTATTPVIIGRSPKSLPGHTPVIIISPGQQASRTHAVLDIDAEGRLIVTDQATPNGTWVNGKEIEPHTPTIVSPGARLELGDAVIHIEALVPTSPTSTGTSSTAIARTHKEQES